MNWTLSISNIYKQWGSTLIGLVGTLVLMFAQMSEAHTLTWQQYIISAVPVILGAFSKITKAPDSTGLPIIILLFLGLSLSGCSVFNSIKKDCRVEYAIQTPGQPTSKVCLVCDSLANDLINTLYHTQKVNFKISK